MKTKCTKARFAGTPFNVARNALDPPENQHIDCAPLPQTLKQKIAGYKANILYLILLIETVFNSSFPPSMYGKVTLLIIHTNASQKQASYLKLFQAKTNLSSSFPK